MCVIKHLILYLWQLPQNLLGLLFLLFIRKEVKHKLYGITFYSKSNFPGGISIGQYIILGHCSEKSIKHEYGHCIQSKILGPLYLIVVGIPSLIHAAFHDCKSIGKSYYHYWTESWANNLMNIKE